MSSSANSSYSADSSVTTKRRRKALDMEIKMKIIEAYEAGEKITQIARTHELSVSTVSTIIKDKDRIREAVKEKIGLKSTILTKRRQGIITEMEKLLMSWIGDQLHLKNNVNLLAIQIQARNIFNSLKQQKGESCQETFTASKGWYHRFKRRFDLQDLQDNFVGPQTEFQDEEEMIDEKFLIPEQILSVEDTNFIQKIEVTDLDIKQERNDEEETKEDEEKNLTGKAFTPKGLAEFFSKLDEGLKLLESMDSDNERFSRVEKEMQNAVQCYRDIYESPIPVIDTKPSTSKDT